MISSPSSGSPDGPNEPPRLPPNLPSPDVPPPRPTSGPDLQTPLKHTSFHPGHFDVTTKGGITLWETIENLAALLRGYGIGVCYNLMTHKPEVTIPGQTGVGEVQNAAWGVMLSLCRLNKLRTSLFDPFMVAIAQKNAYHPVGVWLGSIRWDGQSRLQRVVDSLVTPPGFDLGLKSALVIRWLVSAVAAVLAPGFWSRGVLTLQGAQGIGKTTWFKKLFADASWFQTGLSLDLKSKDSVTQAVSHWVAELGELEGILRKADIAMLKSFLTQDFTEIRLPYLRREERFPRQTVYCASVNEAAFLADSTGSTRFWVIPLMSIKPIDVPLDELWAEVKAHFDQGTQWWLTDAEEALLAASNEKHQEIEEFEEQVLELFDPLDPVRPLRKTATEVLVLLGVHNPAKTQLNRMARVLRKYFPLTPGNGKKTYALPSMNLGAFRV